MEYFARTRNPDLGPPEKQLLRDHLYGVAELAAAFASEFGSGEWGRALGLLHDVGKGSRQWQEYLFAKNGYDEEAASESASGIPGRLDHSGPGAKIAEDLFGKTVGRFLAYAASGHHTGLPDWIGTRSSLGFRLGNTVTDNVDAEIKKMFGEAGPKLPPWKFDQKGLDVSLWLRMLFSCLVDADRLNSEKFADPAQSAEREGYASIEELGLRFDKKMADETQKPSGIFDKNV